MADRQFSIHSEPVAVVLPTYNEAENIEPLIREILAQDPAGESTAPVESKRNPQYRVIVVDDSSPDGTGRLVRDMMGKDPRIDLVEREGKLGLGTAYVAGYRRAMELGAEWIFTMDADFSHDPKHIPEILAVTGNAAFRTSEFAGVTVDKPACFIFDCVSRRCILNINLERMGGSLTGSGMGITHRGNPRCEGCSQQHTTRIRCNGSQR